MGTTLTGLTPATTYDALIKVTDNGPLGGSLKTLTDGLGNDSALALSTGAASVTGTLAVSSNLTVDTNTLFVDATNNRVGVGTTTFTNFVDKLRVVGDTNGVDLGGSSSTGVVRVRGAASTGAALIDFTTLATDPNSSPYYQGRLFYNFSDNSLAIHTNSAERLRITSAGNVGIGTSSPNRLLTIKNSSDGANGLSFQSYASTSELGYIRYEQTNDILDIVNTSSFASGGLKFSTSNTERMRITSSGLVGIGTSSPSQKLHVEGSIALAYGSSLHAANATYTTLLETGYNGSSDFVSLYTAGNNAANATAKITMLANGLVGIGTSTPSIYATLTVNKNGASEYSSVFATNANSTAALYVGVGGSSVGNTALRNNAYVLNASASDLILGTSDTERMRITAAGDIGINTSTPQTKFQIGGVGDANANAASISFGDGNSINSRNWAITNGLSAAGANQVGALTFSISNALNGNPLSAGSEVARFDSSGNLSLTSGNILLSSAGGIYFDSGASKYLDDYEFGTWTPTISFGGASVGVTYAAGVAGQYTKVGRQVSVTAYILLTSKGSSSGAARIGGLPFTIGNAGSYYGSGSLGALSSITYGGQIQTYAEINTTNFVLNDISEAGVQGNITDADFANDSQILFSATYFV